MTAVSVHPSRYITVPDNVCTETNISAARQLGWGHCVHFSEDGLTTTEGGVRKMIISNSEVDVGLQVQSLHDLRQMWPEIFIEG